MFAIKKTKKWEQEILKGKLPENYPERKGLALLTEKAYCIPNKQTKRAQNG